MVYDGKGKCLKVRQLFDLKKYTKEDGFVYILRDWFS